LGGSSVADAIERPLVNRRSCCCPPGRSGFDPADVADRERLRANLGYAPGEQVCVVSVGGSGVGQALLERVMAAFAHARSLVPALRMIVVAEPRIDPASLPRCYGPELRAYVPDLYRHLAACDSPSSRAVSPPAWT
jgi:hypothetical protein